MDTLLEFSERVSAFLMENFGGFGVEDFLESFSELWIYQNIYNMLIEGKTSPLFLSSIIPGGDMKRLALLLIFYFIFAPNLSLAQEFWEHTQGPYVASEITKIFVGSNNFIYAANDTFYKSTNNGFDWIKINVGTASNKVKTIADFGNNIYIGTTEGVFLSEDFGENWISINNGLTGQSIIHITININGFLYVATGSNGIYRSTDNGENWNTVNNGLGNYYMKTLTHNSSGTLFAGNYVGFYKSTDYGENWIPSGTGLTARPNALGVNSNDHLFAVCGTNGGAFRSTDNGDNWVQINNGLENTDLISIVISSSGKIYAGDYSKGVYCSDDNGESWTNYLGSYPTLRVNDMGNNVSEIVYAGTNEGLLRTTDYGITWQPFNQGLNDYAFISSMAIDDAAYFYAGLGGGGLARSTNNGDNWEKIECELSNIQINCFFPAQNNQLFAGTAGNGIFLSTNNGLNWVNRNSGLTDLNVYSILKLSNGDMFIGTGGGLFYSNDNGLNWAYRIAPKVLTFAVSPNGNIYAGLSGNVLRSTNNGTSWQAANVGLTNRNVTALAVNSVGYIYAATLDGINGGVFRSTDDAYNWVAINNGLNTTYNKNYALTITNNDHIFVSSNFQVYRSTNNGDQWVRIPWGLTGTTFNFTIKPDEYIFAGTNEGIFRSPQHKTTLSSIAITGSQILEVGNNAGFNIGDNIMINPGGINEEINKVVGYGDRKSVV